MPVRNLRLISHLHLRGDAVNMWRNLQPGIPNDEFCRRRYIPETHPAFSCPQPGGSSEVHPKDDFNMEIFRWYSPFTAWAWQSPVGRGSGYGLYFAALIRVIPLVKCQLNCCALFIEPGAMTNGPADRIT